MPEVHILPTPEEAAHAAAALVVSLAEGQVPAQGRFTIALCGGSSPRALYRLLASPPYTGQIAWDRCYVFWGDERCVPPDHPDSNYRMARETLMDRVPIPADHVHRIRGEAEPEVAAQEYEEVLRHVFQSAMPAFDLILLGIGEDGHTASLFPGTPALRAKRRLVVANWVPHLGAPRITFTLPLINSAAAVAFLASEVSKARVIRQVLAPVPGDPVPPAALVRPYSGAVYWFLTCKAASQLAGMTSAPGLQRVVHE